MCAARSSKTSSSSWNDMPVPQRVERQAHGLGAVDRGPVDGRDEVGIARERS